jgi:integrase/recombinase XerD
MVFVLPIGKRHYDITMSHSKALFDQQYQRLLQYLTLQGLQPKTVDAYPRAVRRAGAFFDHPIDDLSTAQLTDHFSALGASHSWPTVKFDVHGLKFYYQHVLQKPWIAPGLVKPPKVRHLPNLVTRAQLQQIISATRVLSYRAFFFVIYSLGLRLGEGLRLNVADIDARTPSCRPGLFNKWLRSRLRAI